MTRSAKRYFSSALSAIFAGFPGAFKAAPARSLKLFGAGVSRNDAGSSDLSPATETVSKEHYMGQARGGGPKIYWLLFKRRRFANERIAAARFTRSCAHQQQPQQHQ